MRDGVQRVKHITYCQCAAWRQEIQQTLLTDIIYIMNFFEEKQNISNINMVGKLHDQLVNHIRRLYTLVSLSSTKDI